MNELYSILQETYADNAWIPVITAVISLSAALAAVFQPKEGTNLAKVFSVINALALNIGRAKNSKNK